MYCTYKYRMNLYHGRRKTGVSTTKEGWEGEFGLGIKWMALLVEGQKCRLPLLLSLSPLNGSIIEGQWERDFDLELSGVTEIFLGISTEEENN